MSELRLEWDAAEKQNLLEARLERPDDSPVDVCEAFNARNHRVRTINSVRPKLKELDDELGLRGRGATRRGKQKSKFRRKSMWLHFASPALTKQKQTRKPQICDTRIEPMVPLVSSMLAQYVMGRF